MAAEPAAPPAAQPSAKTRALYDAVVKQCERMIELANGSEDSVELRKESVSNWSVRQHLEHMARADGFICMMAIEGALKKPPQNVDQKPKFQARILLMFGHLPRGKGKSPEPLMPKAESIAQAKPTIQGALMLVKKLESRLAEFDSSTGRTPHPILGAFRAKDWLRFLDIHHRHHFKIIDDIKKAS